MNRNEFLQMLKAGTLSGAVLFEGEEENFKQSALQSLRRAILPEGFEDLNETVMEGGEADAVIAATETIPFMADKRLIVVRDHPALTGRSEADEKLLDYLTRVPDTAILLFYCTGKPDGRKKLYTAVKKNGKIFTFDRLKNQELTSWVTASFHELGKECDDRTADFLIFTCGTDSNLLSGEITKIASYRPDDPAVSADDIRALATPSTECTVFAMVDAVVAGQSARALSLMRNLLRSGEDRIFLLAMLLRQFKMLQHVKIMQFEKQSRDYIVKHLGVPPFAAEQYIRQAASYTGGQVKQAVRWCLDMEFSVKSGRINQEGSLETVMLRLLTMKKTED